MNLVWLILTIIAVGVLIYSWNKRGGVWGGLTMGAIVGLLVAVIYLILGHGFSWSIVGKGGVIGVIVSIVLDFLPKKRGAI